ncbi:MAG: hypothetical protein WCB53_03015 [Terriglobales bacterium]
MERDCYTTGARATGNGRWVRDRVEKEWGVVKKGRLIPKRWAFPHAGPEVPPQRRDPPIEDIGRDAV